MTRMEDIYIHRSSDFKKMDIIFNGEEVVHFTVKDGMLNIEITPGDQCITTTGAI